MAKTRKSEAPPRFHQTVWMRAEIPLTRWQRVRLFFGSPLAVELRMPTEKSPGRTGGVSGMVVVGKLRT